ncbi:Serine/threonine-protein kinase PknD [compost metagenome]
MGASNLSNVYRVDDELPMPFNAGTANMVTGLDGTVWIAGLNANHLTPWTEDGGYGTSIPLTHWAHGLAVSKDGAIWSAQRYANLIGRSVPGSPTETFSGFSEVGSLAVDSSGNIWAATIGDGRLVQLAP